VTGPPAFDVNVTFSPGPAHRRLKERPAEFVTGGTVGPEATLTVSLWLALPPGPEQDRVKVEFEVTVISSVPFELFLLPDHPPDAVHELALDIAHVISTEPPPTGRFFGEAPIVIEGAGETGAGQLIVALPITLPAYTCPISRANATSLRSVPVFNDAGVEI
jgi:hypothetical protein